MTRKNSKAMNHFKLRKYPILYLEEMREAQITKMVDEYIGTDFAEQVTKSQINRVKMELTPVMMKPKHKVDDSISSDVPNSRMDSFDNSLSMSKNELTL